MNIDAIDVCRNFISELQKFGFNKKGALSAANFSEIFDSDYRLQSNYYALRFATTERLYKKFLCLLGETRANGFDRSLRYVLHQPHSSFFSSPAILLDNSYICNFEDSGVDYACGVSISSLSDIYSFRELKTHSLDISELHNDASEVEHNIIEMWEIFSDYLKFLDTKLVIEGFQRYSDFGCLDEDVLTDEDRDFLDSLATIAADSPKISYADALDFIVDNCCLALHFANMLYEMIVFEGYEYEDFFAKEFLYNENKDFSKDFKDFSSELDFFFENSFSLYSTLHSEGTFSSFIDFLNFLRNLDLSLDSSYLNECSSDLHICTCFDVPKINDTIPADKSDVQLFNDTFEIFKKICSLEDFVIGYDFECEQPFFSFVYGSLWTASSQYRAEGGTCNPLFFILYKILCILSDKINSGAGE